jgi:hypothetical protein
VLKVTLCILQLSHVTGRKVANSAFVMVEASTDATHRGLQTVCVGDAIAYEVDYVIELVHQLRGGSIAISFEGELSRADVRAKALVAIAISVIGCSG